MRDSINEVGKLLRKTKNNSEAALRRHALNHPRVDRVRDLFDDVVPFEMEFETKPQEHSFNMDLYFNKPPPLNCINHGQYVLICENFTVEVSTGSHLIQLESSYWPGSVTVYFGATQIDTSQYSEYDPVNGLVYVVVPDGVTEVTICYLRNTWTFQCPESLDPLNGSPNSNGAIAGTYSGHYEDFFGSGIPVDTDENTQIPQGGYYNYAGFAQYSAYIDDHSGLLTWDTEEGRIQDVTNSISTNGNLNFVPTYNLAPYTNPNYNVSGLPIVDGNNVRCTFSYDLHCGENFGQTFVGFFGGYPERTHAYFEVGPIKISLEEDHDLINPLPPNGPFPPRVSIMVENSGNMNSLGKCYSNPALNPFDGGCIPGYQSIGSFEVTTASLPFNTPVSVFIDINMAQDKIEIIINGVSYNFANPIFRAESTGFGNFRTQDYLDGKLKVSWDAATNIVDAGSFYLRMNDVHLSPCGFHPDEL